MSSKLSAIVMGALTLIYVFLLSNTGITMLGYDSGIAKAMGALILVFPVLAIWLTIAEFRFGIQIERLSKQIEAAGSWPQLDFEFRPSGRPTKESAVRVFGEYAKKVEADEDNYLNWFALGLAYDAAGDRRRARAAMRRALKINRG